MTTQMAALDEFVTRARSQNDSHHTDRVQALTGVVSRARDGFRALEKDSQESSTALEDLAQVQKLQRSELEQLAVVLEEETRHPLLQLKTELSGSTLSEYVPTGQTPPKRDWNYPSDLPRTESHDSIIARLRGLPDPALATTTPKSARTPARSPRKQVSPRKAPASPSKIPSPSKTKIFTDIVMPTSKEAPATVEAHILTTTTTVPLKEAKSGGLKEIDINVVNSNKSFSTSTIASSSREDRPVLLDFSKSVGSGHQQPPLKRHATANAVVESKLPHTKMGRVTRSTVAGIGVENFSQSVGPMGGRRLRSSPPE